MNSEKSCLFRLICDYLNLYNHLFVILSEAKNLMFWLFKILCFAQDDSL